MLRDRYEIDKFFVEIQGLTSEMGPQLAQIDSLLDADRSPLNTGGSNFADVGGETSVQFELREN